MNKESSLRENILSLFVVQGANYILPLITVPYLVRVLGPAKFGLLAFAQAFMQYFVLLTDYGFNLSATRLISIHRSDIDRRSEIFWSTIWTKIILMLISFVLMACIVFIFKKFRQDSILYFIVFLMVAGNVLFPVWYFQGMERMKLISALNISARIISVSAIFMFVHNKGDYLIAGGLQAGGMVLSGLLGLYFLPKLAPLRFVPPTPHMIYEALKEGWHIFISTAGISFYVNSTAFVLGIIAGDAAVGYFSAAQKLVNAVQGLITPVSQAIYPRVSVLIARSHEEGLKFLGKTLKGVGVGGLLISICLFILAKPGVIILLGAQYVKSIVLVRWMAFMPLIVGLSNIFGVQTMIPFGMKAEFSRILIGSGILNLIILVPLVTKIGATGAAVSLTVTEVVVTTLMAVTLRKKGIHYYHTQMVKA